MKKQLDRTPLSNLELFTFFQQMSMILQSGISPYEGILIMEEDAVVSSAKELFHQIGEELSLGSDVYTALSSSKVFPSYALRMVQIGEYTGTLDRVCTSLASYYHREDSIAREIRSAMTYPLIMIGIVLVIVGILITKVLPVFDRVYQQLGSEMTGSARALLHLGNSIRHYGLPAAGSMVILLIVYGILIFRKKLRIPFSRKFYEDLAVTRFAGGLSLILGSGLDYSDGLQMLLELSDYEPMTEKIRTCIQLTENGTDFTDALKESQIFEGLYSRMVSVGIRTGQSDEAIAQVAEKYQEQISLRTEHMIGVLEPTVVSVLAVLVGMILLSVMFPLLGVLTGMSL